VPDWRKVGITTAVNGMLWASLDAGVTFPAHVRFNVEGTSIGLVDVHYVRGADIYAMSAAVATCHVDKSWHYLFLQILNAAPYKKFDQ